MVVAEALTAAFLARQAATAVAYHRQQLGHTSRAKLFAHIRPLDRVLEVGPGEGTCHRHLPSRLRYTAVDAPLSDSAPPLPVCATCESFALLRGAWQALLPALARGDGRGQFDHVIVVLPSTIYFGPDQGVAAGLLRTGLRLPRPKAEWELLSRSAHALLAPRGTLLVADVTSSHSLCAAALLPFSQRSPPLGVETLRRDFARVEVVSGPSRWSDEPELQLRAHKE